MHVHPRFMQILEIGTMPPVDLFPILKYVPERFAAWKQQSKEIRRLHETLYDRLLTDVEDRMKRGLSLGVFMERAIENSKEWGLNSREMLMYAFQSLCLGYECSSFCIGIWAELFWRDLILLRLRCSLSLCS